MLDSKRLLVGLIILLLIDPSQSFSQVQVKGAEYRTKDSYLYGRFEASIKVPGKEGMLASFFTYFDGLPNDPWSSSKWNEIDYEIMGRYQNDVQFNTITPGQGNHVRHQYVNFNPSLDYHTYAFEWTPDYVAWFIDGTEVYKQTEDHVKTLTRAQKIMMNVWSPTSTNWAGIWNDAVLPAFGYYDWVAYYKYTPGAGNYGTGNNFRIDWKDDFNSFDSNRWEKGNHGFGGNRSDFVPENIVFTNGNLILCLTDKTATGYTDSKAPVVISVRALNEYKLRVYFSEQVEKVSAETISNYLLSGFLITKSVLQDDRRTVELTVDKIDFNSLPPLIVRNVKDFLFPANSISLLARTIVFTPQINFPLKINVGGSSYLDFISDREFVNDTSNYGYMQGNRAVNEFQIQNTDNDKIYQSEVNEIAKYVIRIPNGKYRVRLMFAENYFKASGKRVFDVYVQGSRLISSLDIYKEVGANAAIEKTIDNLEVNDYLLDIHFAALIGQPLLNGVIIESLSTSDVGSSLDIPDDFVLSQNYPNPFNPNTVISYKLEVNSFVTLKVYDLLGREIATLVDEFQNAGVHNSQFSTRSGTAARQGSQFASGAYFYTLFTQGFKETKKMILLR